MVAPKTPYDQDICAVCGKVTAGGPSFMRVYLERGRLDFCTPSCAAVFNGNSERFDGRPQLTDSPPAVVRPEVWSD